MWPANKCFSVITARENVEQEDDLFQAHRVSAQQSCSMKIYSQKPFQLNNSH